MDNLNDILQQIQGSLAGLQKDYSSLSTSVGNLNSRVNTLAGVKDLQTAAINSSALTQPASSADALGARLEPAADQAVNSNQVQRNIPVTRRPSLTSRIILTTYPGQAGIDPLPLHWGHADPQIRGPVVVSRNSKSVRRRNGMKQLACGASIELMKCRQLLALTAARTPFIMPWR